MVSISTSFYRFILLFVLSGFEECLSFLSDFCQLFTNGNGEEPYLKNRLIIKGAY